MYLFINMEFIIRKAKMEDALGIFEMAKLYHSESKLRKEIFVNTISDFKKDCFGKFPKMKFYVAEFNDNLLGYCSYFMNYCLISGESVIINESYIKHEYRKLGVSVFLYSKIFDSAFNEKSNLIKWIINMKETHHIAIEKQIGVKISKNVMILNIEKDNMLKYVKNNLTNPHNIRLVKTYELNDVFELVKSLSDGINKEIKTDIYQLLGATFSSNPKINILIAPSDNEEANGILSFFEGYYSSIGKILIIDKVFVNKNKRKEKIAKALLAHILDYASRNNYAKVEMNMSKFDIEKVEQLKEFGFFSYDNIRVAKYYKNEYLKHYNA